MTQFVRAATTKLTADKRKAIAIQALARSASISALAADNGVSRPLIYREVDKARAALDDAFSPTQTNDADKVIFQLMEWTPPPETASMCQSGSVKATT
jgi:transposase-like protein